MTCRNPEKRKHQTAADAGLHLAWLQREKGANQDLHVYRCGDHWHVGHSVIALSKRIRRALRRD